MYHKLSVVQKNQLNIWYVNVILKTKRPRGMHTAENITILHCHQEGTCIFCTIASHVSFKNQTGNVCTI